MISGDDYRSFSLQSLWLILHESYDHLFNLLLCVKAGVLFGASFVDVTFKGCY